MKALVLAALIVIALPTVVTAETMSLTETCRDLRQAKSTDGSVLSDTYSEGESAVVCTMQGLLETMDFCSTHGQSCVGCPPEGQRTDDPFGSSEGGEGVYLTYFPGNPFQGGGYHSIVVSLDPDGC